jgi:hypothetical protein
LEEIKLEKRIYCENHVAEYPLVFTLQIGEGHILVIPWLSFINGTRNETDVCVELDIHTSYEKIGETVYEMKEFILNDKWLYSSRALKGKTAQYKYSRYKSISKIREHNIWLLLENQNESKNSWRLRRFDVKSKTDGYNETLTLMTEFGNAPDPYTLGKAIMDAYEECLVLKNSPVIEASKENIITLMDDRKLCYIIPDEDTFIDIGDVGATECYQAYAIGDMDEPDGYLVIESLADFEEDMSKEHMLEVLISEDEASSGRKVKDYEYSYEEGSYGKEGICRLRVEYRSKTNHRIIYMIDKELGISMSLENMRKKKADKALSDALAVLIESVNIEG